MISAAVFETDLLSNMESSRQRRSRSHYWSTFFYYSHSMPCLPSVIHYLRANADATRLPAAAAATARLPTAAPNLSSCCLSADGGLPVRRISRVRCLCWRRAGAGSWLSAWLSHGAAWPSTRFHRQHRDATATKRRFTAGAGDRGGREKDLGVCGQDPAGRQG